MAYQAASVARGESEACSSLCPEGMQAEGKGDAWMAEWRDLKIHIRVLNDPFELGNELTLGAFTESTSQKLIHFLII